MNIHTPEDIGLVIRDERKRRKLSQSELAEKVGVSRQWVVDIEHGKSRAEIGLLLRTLTVLGVSLHTRDDTMPATKPVNVLALVNIDEVVDRARRTR